MITQVVRAGLRSIMAVALSVALAITATHIRPPVREQAGPRLHAVQTYLVLPTVNLPPLKRDGYEAVMPPIPTPTPTATMSQAPEVPGKSSATDAKNYASTKVSAGEYPCLVTLWERESGWDVSASNPSGAYGIPQALPGSKMAAFGADWQTNYVTQVNWGISYISDTYGTPCAALAHSTEFGWY